MLSHHRAVVEPRVVVTRYELIELRPPGGKRLRRPEMIYGPLVVITLKDIAQALSA